MSNGPQVTVKGPLLGVLALILGAVGVVATFLPINLDLVRPYVAWMFGWPGIVVAVFGLLGQCKGKPLAGIGAMLSLLALAIGAIALGNLVGRA
ncbi:hypothetical protein LFM09_11015 [Lentzea alba]|uniref:hypothetical protein n=1 Tax=Lentzea alba TaxID=2714351 RepID=UPI0039BED027